MADNDPAADHVGVDVDAVQSLAAFARACDRLRASRSYAELDKAARPRSLPAATLNNLLNAKGTPTRDTVIKFLIACGLDDATAQAPWLAAWERVATAHQPRPDGAVRVRDARPRMLGVHAAIQIPGTAEELPPYVPRDLDADLRTAVTAAAASGGLVLMVGGSSVGKTRALYEAVRATMPEWWLLHPADAAAVAGHAAAPTPRTVVWLDELQRYLNHPGGLPVGVIQQLVTTGTVVVATLWPDEYSMRTARPLAGQPDPYANDRDLLRLAHLLQVPEIFSPAERRRGETLAPTDERIRVALDLTDAGFTQVLAAGPALIQHWEQAPDGYGKAVITAALDARRVGAQHPLTRAFLEAAAPAYLTPAQQATAPPDWLEYALAYATTDVRGATACLTPIPAGMGRIAGYITADYLHQHAQRTRRTTALPVAVWNALVDHHHPDDALSLADNARRRGQPGHVIAIYERFARSGDHFRAIPLAAELIDQGHVDQALQLLRDYPAISNEVNVFSLADMLVEQGRPNEALQLLRDCAATGHEHADSKLLAILFNQGRIEDALTQLRDRAANGNAHAAAELAIMLRYLGRIDELRDRLATGDGHAFVMLIELLLEQGRIEEELPLLRDRASRGDRHACYALAQTLAQHGQVGELRDRAAAGDEYATRYLVDMLLAQDGAHEAEAMQLLRDRAPSDQYAASRLVDELVKRNRIDEAVHLERERAVGHSRFPHQLADVLLEQDRVEEAIQLLLDRKSLDPYGRPPLLDMLVKHGYVEEALQLLRDLAATDTFAGSWLVDELAKHGRADELRDRAAVDNRAAQRLVEVLFEQGCIDELRDRAAHDEYASHLLAEILANQGHVDMALQALRDRTAAGSQEAAGWLVDMLFKYNRIDELRLEMAAGTLNAANALAALQAQ